MKTKAICCLLTLFLVMCHCVKAQEKLTIHVVNEPLISVLHLIEKQAGVLFAYRNEVIDVHDRITIHWDNVPLKTILDVIFPSSLYELRFIGKQIVILKKQAPVPVTPPPHIIDITPVVITALGISRQQRSLGYAYADLGPQTFTINPVSTLSGKVSGLNITPVNSGVGGSAKVTLRGLKIIGGDNTPMFVIDGIPVNNSSPGQADKYGGYDLGDGTSIINPDEIASISILKGGSASALYGSRAANGVIIITTKKGNKGVSVEYTANMLVEKLNNSYDFQHEYGSGQDGFLPKDVSTARVDAQKSWGPKMSKDSTVVIWDGRKVPYVNASNAISKFFRKGLTLTNSVSLSTGTDKAQLRATYTNVRNNDIIPRSKLDRHHISLRGTAKLSSKLILDAKGTYLSEDVFNRPALSDNPNNIGYVLSGIAPNIDINWLKKYKDSAGDYINWNNNAYQVNPYWAINEQPNNSTQRRFNGFLLLKYQLWPGLYIQGRTGTDYSRFSFTEFMQYSTPYYTTGGIVLLHRNLQETNSDLLVNYHKKWDRFSLEINVGTNRMDYIEDVRNITGRDMKTRGVKNLNNFETQLSSHQLYRKRINSVYGGVTIGYDAFLYLDLTGRNDWSSTLSAGHNAYFYPSASASFVFSSLLPSNAILSFGKLRASIAQTGTDAIAPYQTALTYATNPDIPSVGGYLIGGVATDKVPYENLKPSISRSYETGLNMVFFDNRINLDLTWYHSNTRNQILNAPISPTSGYTSAVINSGDVSNEGVEISLGGRPICNKDFKWQVNANFARNRNKIISLSSLVSDYYTLASARWGNASIIAKAGSTYGMITGKKFLRDENGQMVLDANYLPQYTSTDYNLGSTQYNWIGGITNTFTYRRWSCAVLLDIKQGGKIFSMTNLLAYQNGQQKGTLEGREGWARSEKERIAAGVSSADWTPTGGLRVKGVKIVGLNRPQYEQVDRYVNPETYWTRVTENIPEPFVYDAGMVKIRELTLGYRILKEVSVSVIARNLLTLSKHVPNIDPESSYNSGDGQGFEYGSLPTRRAYGITLHAKF
ncbi:MAG: TonB-dependent receptor plug [Bacteroidetes bacterium]|nr:TonB-dependent receptor plug [Bacteroidota bacterium]